LRVRASGLVGASVKRAGATTSFEIEFCRRKWGSHAGGADLISLTVIPAKAGIQ